MNVPDDIESYPDVLSMVRESSEATLQGWFDLYTPLIRIGNRAPQQYRVQWLDYDKGVIQIWGRGPDGKADPQPRENGSLSSWPEDLGRYQIKVTTEKLEVEE